MCEVVCEHQRVGITLAIWRGSDVVGDCSPRYRLPGQLGDLPANALCRATPTRARVGGWLAAVQFLSALPGRAAFLPDREPEAAPRPPRAPARDGSDAGEDA